MLLKRPKFFVIIISSFLIILLVISLTRFLGTQTRERTAKIYEPLSSDPQKIKQREETSKFWEPRSEILPQLSHFFRPPEDGLSERNPNPRSDPIFWHEVQEDLGFIIKEKFPDLNLSERELHELIETIKTIQFSMEEMRELERTGNNREAIIRTRSQLDRALELFGEITKMDPTEFILRGRLRSGIDKEERDEEEVVKEYLSDLKP